MSSEQEQTEELYHRSLANCPQQPTSLALLATVAIALKHDDDAISLLNRAIQLEPNNADHWIKLGSVIKRAGRLTEAIAIYRRAIELAPTSADAHNDLGNALADANELYEAVKAYRTAIELNPHSALAHNNLGAALRDTGQPDDAIAAYEVAIKLKPDFAEAFNNRGVALADLGRFTEAIASYRRATEAYSDYADAHMNLAVALCNVGEQEVAVAHAEQAIALNPDSAEAHNNFGLILLALGDYERGMIEHEWRHRANPRIQPRQFVEPQWVGEDLAGRTILLHAEQGFGDTIQFARYIPLVTERDCRVLVECQPELVGTLRCLAGGKDFVVLAKGEPLPAFDLQCSLLSLPLAFGTSLHSILANVPYITPPIDLVERWRSRISPHADELKAGLVWAGRPTHTNDHNRSMTLDQLEPLAEIPGVQFFSLQKGPAAAKITAAPHGLRLVDYTAELVDFIDTAALIAQLDLVIAVDTAVAHLAGALGKEVWLLLPLVPDWRWIRERDDSPWYPTMRLFRQSRWGEWKDVVSRVAIALAERIASV